MNVATKLSIAIAFLMISAPAAIGSWSASGNFEPNTAYDTPDVWMWENAPAAGETRIYFNAFAVTMPGGAGYGLSPNVGVLETRNEVPNSEYHTAVFGLWVDCNGDGYIGMAEQAIREYASELLLDDSVCPAESGPSQVNGGIQVHNYNGWVSEYIPIAHDPGSGDQRVIPDDDAMVWGDYGRPDEKAFFRSCALYPQPRGTYQSTGGFLNYVECRTQQNGLKTYENFNAAMDAIGDPAGLRGEDGPEFDWRTTGLEMPTFGSEDTQYSPATIWDCEADPTLHVGDTYNSTPLDETQPLGGEQSSVVVPAIAPTPSSADPTTFTVPALVNHTEEGTQDCDTSNDAGHDFYGTQAGFVGETDFNGVSPNNKHESDWNMGFGTSARGVVPFGPALGSGNAGAAGGDAGALWLGGSGWYSPSVYGSKLGFRTVKADLNGEDPTASTAGVSPAWWLTFYAHAGPATAAKLLQTTSGTGVYGSWQCGEEDAGIHNGWNCDVRTWNVNPDGSPLPAGGVAKLAVPGLPYEFRDVDCYDGSNNAGVGIQPAFYGDQPCF